MIRRSLNPYGITAEHLLRPSEPIAGRAPVIDPKTGLVLPPTAASLVGVTTVFDARPINTGDFEFPVWSFGSIGSPGPLSVVVKVPAGFVAVVRAVSWDIQIKKTGASIDEQYDVYGIDMTSYPIATSPWFTLNNIFATLTNNGVPIDGYARMPLGLIVEELPCYFIVDQNTNMGITFTPEIGDAPNFINQAFVRFHGNLLRKSGRWTQLEPGSVAIPGFSSPGSVSVRPVYTPPAASPKPVRQAYSPYGSSSGGAASPSPQRGPRGPRYR